MKWISYIFFKIFGKTSFNNYNTIACFMEIKCNLNYFLTPNEELFISDWCRQGYSCEDIQNFILFSRQSRFRESMLIEMGLSKEEAIDSVNNIGKKFPSINIVSLAE